MRNHLFAALIAATLLTAGPCGARQAATPPEGPRPIRLNQVGFETGGVIAATVDTSAQSSLPWRLVDDRGRIVRDGSARLFGPDPASGETPQIVVVEQAPAPGRYMLRVGDLARAVSVSDHPFARLKFDALAYFYQNRAGVPIEAAHVARSDLARPPGHVRETLTCFSGVDQRGVDWPACDYALDVTGGWYDAGDHGKYVVNGGIAVWTLLNAWERAHALGLAPFADGRADIPEAGDDVDDLMNEARYEIEFLLQMQIPDDARTWVAGPDGPRRIDGSGLVHHKAHDRAWTALPTAPADDPQPRFLYPASTAATLNLAAVGAQCARLWRPIDPAFADRCLGAARLAWDAAGRHPDLIADGGFDGGGAYGDPQMADERYWAGAELYVTTGEAIYRDEIRRSPYWLGGPRSGASATGDPAYAQTAALGSISLALSDRLSREDQAVVRDHLVEAARAYLAEADSQAYGLPQAGERFDWGSNGALLNRALIMGLAHDFTGDPVFRQGVARTLDYLLGRNPLDRSYVSGYGDRPMRHPHHRFWTSGAGPEWPDPPAGALSGGPNTTAMVDEVARAMVGRCAPLACWADDYRAYALNEVAINWNAPLVWVAAFLDPS